MHIVRIVGGFFAIEDRQEGCDQLLEIHNVNVKIAKLRDRLATLKTKIDYFESLEDKVKKNGKSRKKLPIARDTRRNARNRRNWSSE
jgi:hypothetical protein